MKSTPLYIVGFMVAIAAVFGGGVTAIYLGSAGTLERNAAFFRQRALIQVFGLGDPGKLSKRAIAEIVEKHVVTGKTYVDPETGRRFEVMLAYEDAEHSRLKAQGFPFRGLGFWGPVRGILALTPDASRTVGIVVLEQSETPGLGGRIEEPVFTRQFEGGGVLVTPNPDGPFVRVVPPPRDGGREVEAITGATQTSMAMERILNTTLESYHRATGGAALAD